jgi:hypothetical protein
MATDPAFATGVAYDQSNLTDTTATPTGLVGQTTYHWRVRASTAGGTGLWSASRSFTTGTPATVTLVYPTNGLTNVPLSTTLRWNRAFAATHYQVQVSTNSTFSSLVVDSSNIADTSLAISGLQGLRNHYWRVRGANAAGIGAWPSFFGFRTVQVVAVEEVPETPAVYQLEQNFPNPFNPVTEITYELPSAAFVTLKVYDPLGREVTGLVNDRKEAGIHAVRFDGAGLTSGVYFYRITAGTSMITKAMILSK